MQQQRRTEKEGRKWRSKFKQILGEAGLESHNQAWTSSKPVGHLPERMRESLDIAWCLSKKKAEMEGVSDDDLAAKLVIDLSQCPSRQNYTQQLRSITTGSRFYSYGLQRTVHAYEHLSLLGIVPKGKRKPQEVFSSHELRELAGEAFPAPAVAVCMMALLLALPPA